MNINLDEFPNGGLLPHPDETAPHAGASQLLIQRLRWSVHVGQITEDILGRVRGCLDLSGQSVPSSCPGRCRVRAGGLPAAQGGLLAAELPLRQECRRPGRFIFILAPAVMCPASPTLGQLRSGIQPGSVFNSGSIVAD